MAETYVPNAGLWLDAALYYEQLVDDAAFVMLFKNDVDLTEPVSWADLTEADFSGYARELLLAGGSIDVSGDPIRARLSPPEVTFTRGAGATSNNIYGWALIWEEPETPGNFFVAIIHKYSLPIAMTDDGSEIPVQIRYDVSRPVEEP